MKQIDWCATCDRPMDATCRMLDHQHTVRVQVEPERVFISDVVGETLEIPYACRVESIDVSTQRITLRVSGD